VIPLVMIRHGPTAWSTEGRIQGRSDPPLSEAGRAAVESWRLPADMTGSDWIWLTSPLARARQTAALLRPARTAGAVRVEPRLAEMDWGAWEGERLAELRARDAVAMAAAEARGLDFRPPGGESPRDVQARLAPLLGEVAEHGQGVIAIAHKGVIRALYAGACGWDMTGRAPVKTRDACAHRFALDAADTPRVERLNIPLIP